MKRFGLILGMMLIAVLVPTAVFADDTQSVETQMKAEITAVAETVVESAAEAVEAENTTETETTEAEVVIIEDQMIPVLGAEAIEAEAEAAMAAQDAEAVETETTEEIVEETAAESETIETAVTENTEEAVEEIIEAEAVAEIAEIEETVVEEIVAEPEMVTMTLIHRLFVGNQSADYEEEITCEAGATIDLSNYTVALENVVCESGADEVIAEAGQTFVIGYSFEF